MDVKADQEKMPISTLIRSKQAGFTLIEVMIVVAILAMAMSLFVGNFTSDNRQLKSMVYGFKNLSRKIQYTAKLKNSTYRLVVDMGDDRARKEDRVYQYWLEVSTKSGLITSERQEEVDNESLFKEEEPKQKDFIIDKKLVKEKRELPDGVKFSGVYIKGFEDTVRNGKVYIYFTPQGLVDEAIVYIDAGENRQWTLATHPLTGRIDIFSGELSPKELSQ